jgi:adenosylmethionine-8-amino-7-oxononanoate aminotransferase
MEVRDQSSKAMIDAGARPAIGGAQDVFRAKEIAPLPLFVRGAGVRLWDDAGNEYIDVSSGPVVSNIGHGNPRVVQAIAAQALALDYLSSRQGRTRANIELSEKIAKLAGPGYERVCLSSGGSEANEIAIKFLRQYAVATGQSSRTKIISCMPSYHGSTIATLGLSGDTGSRAFLDGFGIQSIKIPAPLSYRLPNGQTAEGYAEQVACALEKAILDAGAANVLAFIIEPVGGLASGCAIPPKSFFRRVREICDTHGIFLAFDEVLCGSGRTGAFLASRELAGVQADVVVLAKGLGAGYAPLGATLASAKMVDELAALTGFSYMHTYSANPIACAAGLAVLEEMEDGDLMKAAVERGEYLRAGLRRLASRSKIVGDIRGAGLLLAVEIVADKPSKALFRPERQALEQLRICAAKNGLLIYARRTSSGRFGEWFMVSPPLTITQAECDELLQRLASTLRELEAVLSGSARLASV